MKHEYPLVDCYECVHRNVCKWQDQFRKLEKLGLPLDFPHVTCTECALEYKDNPDTPPTGVHTLTQVNLTGNDDIQNAVVSQIKLNIQLGFEVDALVMTSATLEHLRPYLDIRGMPNPIVVYDGGFVRIQLTTEPLDLGTFYLINKI
jgi:hypothetical protein